jgi:hypothetical protein
LTVANINGDNFTSTSSQKHIGKTTSGCTRIETFLSFNQNTGE